MMNCQCFHDQLFEYLDGTLSARARAAAEAHLEQCADCRRATRAHQALAERFQRETDSLAAGPELAWRIEAALSGMVAAPAREHPLAEFWRRFAWPMAGAAALFLAGNLSLFWPWRARFHKQEAARTPATASVSVRLSYCNPAYTFRREKNMVVDALTCVPQVVEENFSLTLNQTQSPIGQTQERKTSL